MDNYLLKGSLKKLEFAAVTPVRPMAPQQTDFQSQLKMKYEKDVQQQINYQNQPYVQTQSTSQVANLNNEQYAYKELFENQIPVKIKSDRREEYATYLNLKIFMAYPTQSHNAVLHLELTDDSNLQFLYVMDCSESDFITLKNEQQLVVDFHSFPNKLTELLDLSNANNTMQDKVNFENVFEIKNFSDGYLKIMELNQFKLLCHLSLKFKSANDEILKNYLASKLSKFCSENDELRIKVQRQEEANQQMAAEKEDLYSRFMQLQNENSQSLEQLQLQEQKKQNDIVSSFNNKESLLTKDYEMQKKTLIEKYESTVNTLSVKVEKLQEQNHNLNETKLHLESNCRDLAQQNKIQKNDITLLEDQVSTLRIDTKNLEKQVFEQQNQITEFRVKNEGLRNQLEDKDKILNQNKELLENTYKQKESLEENLSYQKKQLEKAEIKIGFCSEEITKGNSVIEKLEHENKIKKDKLKEKNQLILIQEAHVREIQGQLDAANKALNDLNRQLDMKTSRIQEIEKNEKELKDKLFESSKIIEQNQSMISYLNQLLNKSDKPLQTQKFGGQSFMAASVLPKTQQVSFTQDPMMNKVDNIVDKYSNYDPATSNRFTQQPKYYQKEQSKSPFKTFKSPEQYEKEFQDRAGLKPQSIQQNQFEQTQNYYKQQQQPQIQQSIYNQDIEDDMPKTIQPIKYKNPKLQ